MFHQTTDDKFKLAIDRLNLLQNVPLLKPHDANDLTKYRLTYTSNMCRKLNISDDDIDGLNVIHITGTKGKGSTCAFIESILRHSGLRTGLFSSPHLIEVRERMKINGASLSYRKFQEYLDYCYDVLVEKWSESDEFEKPSYFQLLTCMMYYAFVKEKVDVAIVEVGIGGQYDCTNIVRNPIACGISSLGLDHCAILGNTIEEIAWQKAGIIKPSCVAFTVNQEPKSALDVIIKRSAEANAPLCLAPPVNKYLDKNLNEMNLGLNGKIQYLNSSLALQIANYWLEKRNTKNFDKLEWVKQNQLELSSDGVPILKPITDLTEAYINGLTKCKWPGRNQIIKSKDESITYYIDGAHTVESIDQFIAWFLDIKRREKPASNDEKNVLLFNYTGERDSSKFLTILLNVDYDMVAFSKLEAYPAANSSPVCDNVRKMPNAALDTDSKYQHLLESFSKLYEEKFGESRKGEKPQCRIFDNILESLNWLTQGRDELLAEQLKNENTNAMTSKPKINVLITGSLYLVGLSLKVLKFPIG